VKPERALVAERAVAQHCAELVRRAPEPADLIPALARVGERFARALEPALAGLTGGEAPSVAPLVPREASEAELIEEAGPLAANSLFATAVPGVHLLASVEGQATLRLVDRAFGGKGEAGGPLPERFPLSAELMIQRLEQLIATCLAEALGHDEVKAVRRDSRLAELAPFPAGARLALIAFEVVEGGGRPWKLILALPQLVLAKLLGQGSATVAAAPRAADPAAAPFAGVPLSLTATLVEMNVPLAALATLAVDAVLPVAVARAVPISVGGAVIARGTVGAQDDRIAIKLTQLA